MPGNIDEQYKAKVKERFKQWIMDLCHKPYDQDWLNYQHEIGLRHMSCQRRTRPITPMHATAGTYEVCNCLYCSDK